MASQSRQEGKEEVEVCVSSRYRDLLSKKTVTAQFNGSFHPFTTKECTDTDH